MSAFSECFLFLCFFITLTFIEDSCWLQNYYIQILHRNSVSWVNYELFLQTVLLNFLPQLQVRTQEVNLTVRGNFGYSWYRRKKWRMEKSALTNGSMLMIWQRVTDWPLRITANQGAITHVTMWLTSLLSPLGREGYFRLLKLQVIALWNIRIELFHVETILRAF